MRTFLFTVATVAAVATMQIATAVELHQYPALDLAQISTHASTTSLSPVAGITVNAVPVQAADSASTATRPAAAAETVSVSKPQAAQAGAGAEAEAAAEADGPKRNHG